MGCCSLAMTLWVLRQDDNPAHHNAICSWTTCRRLHCTGNCSNDMVTCTQPNEPAPMIKGSTLPALKSMCAAEHQPLPVGLQKQGVSPAQLTERRMRARGNEALADLNPLRCCKGSRKLRWHTIAWMNQHERVLFAVSNVQCRKVLGTCQSS